MTSRSASLPALFGGGPVLERVARRIGLAAVRRIRVGCLTVVMPDGARYVFGDRSSEKRGEIRFRNGAALVHMLLHGETGGGEEYMDGGWSSPDLPALLELAALNRDALRLSSGWWRVPAKAQRTLAHRARRNTIGQSRRNIAAHYDLGNDLYRLFLDETLTYSCAVFESPGQSLADAQRNKYRLIAEGAGLAPGMRVLEIGTGWAGFALYAAGELGCQVRTITISREQFELARERVREAGLEELVDVQFLDYREVTGTYDAIVSIEMLEAVGAEYYETFFRVCDRALVPSGRLSIQTIAMRHDDYEPQRQGANWIQQYIFPGGLLPSLTAIEDAVSGTSLLFSSVRDIREHYVLTLRAWRQRFLENADQVRALGFDERFIRMWEYYLSISEAGFRTGLSQDYQIVLEKGRGIAP
jgi:cyclopropane-fatty-acyl-phospholipid synthase